jgi:hypothetical protein
MKIRPIGKTLFAMPKLAFVVSACALLLMPAPCANAQSVDFSPAGLGKQRTAIILKATHTPLAQLENDIDHLAVLSETCRAESGAKACGLSDKPLPSSSLEDRYAYYVRNPEEAQAGARRIKVDRHNWEAPASASR